MPDFFFFPHDGADLHGYATAYLDRFQTRRGAESGAVLEALPPVLDLPAVLAHLPPERRAAAERYLAKQAGTYTQLGVELMPVLPAEVAEDPEFVALAGAWRDYGPGTIGCVRRSNQGGLFALFPDWTLDAAGRVTHTPSEPALPPLAVPSPPRVRPAAVAASGTGTTVARHLSDTVLELANYVGQGLAMSGWPVLGLLVSFLSSETQQLVDGALSESDRLLDEIGTMLEANKVSLELDLAKAEVKTYQDFMKNHYDDAWLEEIMNAPDPTTTDYKDKLAKLRKFVKKITSDFDSTARVFTAVNLMRADPPTVGSDVDKPSEAMSKASGFLYLSLVVLTIGRQAFNAELTMEGEEPARKVAGLLASFSKIYTEYAQSLKAVVDQQVESRVALIGFGPQEGGRVEIIDRVTFNPRIYEKDWDYDADYQWFKNCCGSSDCGQAYSEAQQVLPQLQARARAEYRQYLCAKFWDGTDQSFDEAIAAMVENDQKLQALTTDPGGPT